MYGKVSFRGVSLESLAWFQTVGIARLWLQLVHLQDIKLTVSAPADAAPHHRGYGKTA